MRPNPALSFAQRAEPAAPRIWSLRLWGLANPRLDLAVTALTVLVLAASRFALLPSGPWEWDETLFARGILRFDLHAHFPHPPGFPLWLALGWLTLPFVSEPLRGLQLLSSAASVLTLWPLAALGRRVAPPAVATTAALVFLLGPGVWLHAVRGFSSTPAAFLALWAAALAAAGLAGRGITAFTLLLTAAFLVRPVLLLPFAALWLAGALSIRPRRKLLPGVLLGAAAVLVSTLAMILAQGSARDFVAAFSDHAVRHARGLLENPGGFAELGLVKGIGGEWMAVTVLVLVAMGLVAWARRDGRRSAVAFAGILLVGVAQLIWLQDRTYPRYAVPFQLAAAPLAAGAAASVVSPPLAAGTLASLGLFAALRAYPLLVEQHSTLIPGWAAIRFAVEAAKRTGVELVIEPGLLPYASYLQEVDRWHGEQWQFAFHQAPASLGVRTQPKSAYLVVTDHPERYLEPIVGRSWRFGSVSDELVPLTQGRFLKGEVLEGAPLGYSGWLLPGVDEKGVRFMWGQVDAGLLLPPLPPNASLQLDVEPTEGPAPLEFQVNGAAVMVTPGKGVRSTITLPPELFSSTSCSEVAFARYEGYPLPSEGNRLLAIRISGLAITGAAMPWHGSVVTSADRAALGLVIDDLEGAAPAAATLTGMHTPEHFPPGDGAWTEGSAHLRAPASAGFLRLTIWAPRPTPPRLELWLNGNLIAGPLAVRTTPVTVSLPLQDEQTRSGAIDLELRSQVYVPGGAAKAPAERQLGVVLGRVEFRPHLDDQPAGWEGKADAATRTWKFRTLARGVYVEESFDGVRGVWTRPLVRLRGPVGAGHLTLRVWSPRPLPAQLEVWAGGERLAGPTNLANRPREFTLAIPREVAAGGPVELELRSIPFRPADLPGGRDRRLLGIVLSDIAFQPEGHYPPR